MAVFLGIISRPFSSPSSLIHISRPTRLFSPIKYVSISISRNGFSQFPNFLRASLHSDSSTASQAGSLASIEQPEIIFVGTGTSEGIPRVSCLTDPMKTCPVCTKALEPGSKNRRLNTGLLIRYPRHSGTCNILIDVGKFFYHSALKWFPTYGIRTIDAVLITHSHADAIGGL